jgi:hypothetical protein
VGFNLSIVDEVGAGFGCAVMHWHKRNIIVAREKAVYVCGVVERGTCYAYEGAYFPVLFVSYRTIPDVGFVFLAFSHR